MGLNWSVDPYNRFGSKSGGAQGIGGPTNLVLEAMVEVARLPAAAKQAAEVVIVGDSRARDLTERRLASSGDRSVLNLGVGGASFEEMISFLNDQAPRLKSARLLIIGVPLERLAAVARPDRCLEVKPMVANPLRYLANAEMLKHSWAIWRTPAALPEKTVRSERTPAEREKDDKNVRSTWRRMYADFDQERANARVKMLRQAVQPFSVRGTAVVFWSPPIRPDIYSLIDKLDLQKERTRLSAEIGAFGTVIDMTEWPAVAGQTLTFKDPVHAIEGGLILKELQTVFPR